MSIKGKSSYEDMVGVKHGMLMPIRLIKKYQPQRKQNQYLLVCKCDCGNKKTIVASSVRAGRITSCGCRRDQYSKITGKNSSQFTGYEEIRGRYWAVIKSRAANRGVAFKLNIEDVWALYIKQDKRCALSGEPIQFGISEKLKETTASLDRIDSSKGYTLDNVQLVHKTVNIMKNVSSDEDFVAWCDKIHQWNRK